jgi:hypothetical protein
LAKIDLLDIPPAHRWEITRYPEVSRGIQRYPEVSRGIQRYPEVSRGIQRYPEVSDA